MKCGVLPTRWIKEVVVTQMAEMQTKKDNFLSLLEKMQRKIVSNSSQDLTRISRRWRCSYNKMQCSMWLCCLIYFK